MGFDNREPFHDEHGALAKRTPEQCILGAALWNFRDWSGNIEQFQASRQNRGASAVSKETEIANAYEPRRQ